MSESTPNASTPSSPISNRSSVEKFDGDIEKPGASTYTQDSVFDDQLLGKHYLPPTAYESAHRFDSDAVWTIQEEKQLIRRLDLLICLPVVIFFAALQLDRGNIVNALSDNFLTDLGLSSNDYNNGQTIFYVSFLFMELPSQLISKKVGVDRWVPLQMIVWSIVAMSQCFLTNKTGFYITRALLGAAEGGFIPDMVLYLSYYYTSSELPIRLSFFWVSLSTTTILGSLLAAGILQLRGSLGWAGWRYLFLIEGFITLCVGIFAFFYLPPSPTQTASRFRGKDGWFSDHEETILVTRVLKDDPTKSSMHNRQAIGFKDLWYSFSDFDHFPLYLLGLTSFIAPGTVQAYLTLTLKSFGYTTFHTNLLTIPYNVLFIFNNLFLTHLSKWFNEKTIVASIGSWWQFIFLIVLVTIPRTTSDWSKYAIITLFLAYPYCHPILVSWNSRNSGSVRTRSVSASIYNMCVQTGSIVSSQIYRSDDKPLYHRGNKVLLGIVSANLLLFGFTKIYFIYRNSRKAKIWNSFTAEEKDHYLTTTTDKGNQRLDFVFAH